MCPYSVYSARLLEVGRTRTSQTERRVRGTSEGNPRGRRVSVGAEIDRAVVGQIATDAQNVTRLDSARPDRKVPPASIVTSSVTASVLAVVSSNWSTPPLLIVTVRHCSNRSSQCIPDGIITLSAAVGTLPSAHVAGVFQSPPVPRTDVVSGRARRLTTRRTAVLKAPSETEKTR